MACVLLIVIFDRIYRKEKIVMCDQLKEKNSCTGSFYSTQESTTLHGGSGSVNQIRPQAFLEWMYLNVMVVHGRGGGIVCSHKERNSYELFNRLLKLNKTFYLLLLFFLLFS